MIDTIRAYSSCTGCKPGACIDDIRRYICPNDVSILHIHEDRVRISIYYDHIHGSLGAPGLFWRLKYLLVSEQNHARKLEIVQLLGTLRLARDHELLVEAHQFLVERFQFLVESCQSLVDGRQFLGEGRQFPVELLDQLFDMRVQEDDAHSIVHMRSFSNAHHNCNKIGHRKDSYYGC